MKKVMNFWLMAAVVCGLSFVVTSCKDDDNNSSNSNNNATAEELAADNANAFWAVAASLVNPLDATSDYQNKTFEPTIGEAENGNNTVRVVVMPDASAAAAHFSALVDANVTEATASYTYQHDAVGTLTYTKSTDGKSLAKVDVNIKQIPHLQQIVYKTQEQLGTNAPTDGVPYYWFGDIIGIGEGNDIDEYWVCIHAPFTVQGSTEAVWASVSQLPEKNIWTYTASNGYEYAVPTNIGYDKEYMKDMAEMLYAINSPDQWEKNMMNEQMRAFNMVKPENVKYINQFFWNRVADEWKKHHYDNTLFGDNVSLDTISKWLSLDGPGLKLLYKGYSWWTWTSNNLSVYEASLKEGYSIAANARHLTQKEVKKDVIHPKTEVNCTSQLLYESQWVNGSFFDSEQPRYVFRYATSSQLAGKKVTPWESLHKKNNIWEVYSYTKTHGIKVGADEKMENCIVNDGQPTGQNEQGSVDANAPQVGNYITADGKFWDSAESANRHGNPVAVVIHLGGDTRVETGQPWNGLAIAIKREIQTWFVQAMSIKSESWLSWSYVNESCPNATELGENGAMNSFNGWAVSNALKNCKNDQHGHRFVTAGNELPELPNTAGQFSTWFVPSLGQWKWVVESVGGYYEEGRFAFQEGKVANYYRLTPFLAKDTYFWTSTPSAKDAVWCVTLDESLEECNFKKDSTEPITAYFVAFKYGEGGKKILKKIFLI